MKNGSFTVSSFVSFILGGIGCFLHAVRAQESITPSLTGEYEASLRKPVYNSADYNVKVGPLEAGLSAGITTQFTDNVAFSEDHRRSDVIFQPYLTANIFWQLTEVNVLRLTLGAGYSKYVDNSQYDSSLITVAPNSELAFDLYVGGYRFTFFDRFSIQQNPSQEINLSNVARFERIENSVGISVLKDLNRLLLNATYSHYIFKTLDSSFQTLDRSEEQFLASLGFKANGGWIVGVRGTFASVDYDKNFQNSGLQYSVGVYAEGALTRYLRVNAEAGYQGGSFDGGGLNRDQSNLGSWYARLTLDHRLNRYFTESLVLGREAELGFTTNYTDLAYLRYLAQWRLNSKLTLDFEAYYQHGDDSAGAFLKERIDRYGMGLSFNYVLSNHLHSLVGYNFADRQSDLAGRSYYQNLFQCSLVYDF